MKNYIIRLLPKQDLAVELLQIIKKKKINSGFIITCVGSLNNAVLRLADENIIKTFYGKFEIVSLTGTLCTDGIHLHISIADKDGNVFGGHLKEGCTIYTTAEIVIGESTEYQFSRVFDKETGFKELKIETK